MHPITVYIMVYSSLHFTPCQEHQMHIIEILLPEIVSIGTKRQKTHLGMLDILLPSTGLLIPQRFSYLNKKFRTHFVFIFILKFLPVFIFFWVITIFQCCFLFVMDTLRYSLLEVWKDEPFRTVLRIWEMARKKFSHYLLISHHLGWSSLIHCWPIVSDKRWTLFSLSPLNYRK